MRYSLQKAVRMIWLHKGMYALLLLEVAAGMFLFSYCLNATMSCDDTVRRIDEGIGTDAVQLSCYLNGTNYQPDGFPVPPDAVEWMRGQEGAEKLRVEYLPYVRGEVYSADTGERAEVYLLFLNEESSALLGFSYVPETGYIGSRAAEALAQNVGKENEDALFGYSSLTISDNMLRYGEEWECRIDGMLPMEAEWEEQAVSRSYGSVSAEEQFWLSDCMVLPVERMGVLVHAPGLNGKVSMQFFADEWNGNLEILTDFVKKMNADRDDYHFSLTQQSVELHHSAEDLMIPYRTSLWVGISVLAITTSGMIGAFILILHRRERINAVAVACGATYGRLFAELFVEIGSVIFAGTMIGLILSVPAVLRVRIHALAMEGAMHTGAVCICLFICVMSALLICGGATLLVRRKQPSEALKAS
ncbi:MAG: ABC transporter permease [Clostridium sp.]|nr:ABC transporter permease [Clostridium sp.]